MIKRKAKKLWEKELKIREKEEQMQSFLMLKFLMQNND